MTTEYLDFELELGAADSTGGYPLSVIQSPAGNARGTLTLPDALAGFVRPTRRVDAETWAPNRSWASLVKAVPPAWSADPAVAKQVGMQLFDALLTNSGVYGAYAESLGAADARGKGLRIKLRIVAPALAAVPWELLFDVRFGEFVALDHATAIVRYAEVAQPVQPLTVTLPLRILGMAVSPRNLPPLDVAAEKRAVERALKALVDRGDVELVWLDSGTKRELRQALQPKAKPWHVFHFVGHGGYDDGRGGHLILADEAGDADILTADQLARIVAAHDPLRLVLLNACRGAMAGAGDLFSGLATTLIRRGLPAVIAMQSDLPDTAGHELARSFYEGLADGLSVEGALTNARISESIEHGERADWAAPALYLRAPDGVLFALASEDAAPAPQSATPTATVSGGGGVAQGGSVAAGAGGVAVGGNVYGSISVGAGGGPGVPSAGVPRSAPLVKLSGAQLRQFQDALLGAFSAETLRQMVKVELEHTLDAIAGGSNLSAVVFNLIDWAGRTGRLDALLDGALRTEPGNVGLQQVAAVMRGPAGQ